MYKLFQIFDLTAKATAGPILLEKREGPAIRMFYQVLADPKTLPGQYPDQFVLLQIGSQDEDTATITPITPETVATGAEWLRSQQIAAAQGAASLRPEAAAPDNGVPAVHGNHFPALR